VKWRWPWRRRPVNGAATEARQQAEKRLHEARSDWPKVYEARDVFAEMMEAAMRGGRGGHPHRG
jgi:hypothetical protein